MTAMEQKKKPGKKAEQLDLLEGTKFTEDEELATVIDIPKPKVKPGAPDFDWQAEYPDERFYVYTVPEGTKSPAGLTIGLANISEDRAPNPGEMREAYEAGGFAPMWLFIKCVSTPVSLKLQNQLRPQEYNAMLRGWADFAGIELSE